MIIRITGGLGNQMFQYALKKKLDTLYKSDNYLDFSFFIKKKIHNNEELNRVFGINDRKKSPSQFRLLIHSIIKRIAVQFNIPFIKTPFSLSETIFGYYDNLFNLPYKRKFIVDGYWQSEDYFCDIKRVILDSFVFPDLDDVNKQFLDSIPLSSRSVSIHVRRGDYLKSSLYNSLTETSYYSEAITYINNKVQDPFFLVFSDDIEWCRNYFGHKINVAYVDWNRGMYSYRDMQLMSLCNHNIIANSSFSWWGAWLNAHNDKIVISPKRFYAEKSINEKHLIPHSWIRL